MLTRVDDAINVSISSSVLSGMASDTCLVQVMPHFSYPMHKKVWHEDPVDSTEKADKQSELRPDWLNVLTFLPEA